MATATGRAEDLERQLAAAEARSRDAEVRLLEAGPRARTEAESALAQRQAELDGRAAQRQAELDARAAQLDAREGQIAQAEQVAAKSQMGPGVYQVGVDILPGTYKTSGGIGGPCYWAKLTPGNEIIDNHLGAGPAVVTIQEGILFQTQRCDTWHRQG